MRVELTRTVIAEIGINHDGDMDKARRLIQQSRDAGCDGIKFQYRNLSTAYTGNANEIGKMQFVQFIYGLVKSASTGTWQ